jgi:hypothetical protein
MKTTEIFSRIIDPTDAMILKIASERSNSIHCDCSLPFLRAKDNRCNICEKQIRNI